ncbi:Serine/arginine-rich splicing factor SR45 [Penicillium riverlandense]|uniref:Serine/arginine-rich splicing factor SR45 n=1 Tax=Penicillium riverlandense TaxID=1903569 RepID=UPI0025483D4D|nr:Serine/arginine-rich splicing factor SR45 [Penicillium riverlandense]KAJ5806955.1 Serine/arginine-rich splicing factor SR45 [Penicillium riverlandense]
MSTQSRPSPIPSPGRARSSRSVRRSISPRDEPKRSVTRSPVRGRDRSSRTRSPSRGRTPSRSRMGGRRYRSRSFSRTPSPNMNPPLSSKIVVEKLTKNVTEGHLREIFGSFGDIEYLDLPINRAFMTNRGTAYILYYDPADAEAAIAHMHEAQLDGTTLNVSIAPSARDMDMVRTAANHLLHHEDMLHPGLRSGMTSIGLNRCRDRGLLYALGPIPHPAQGRRQGETVSAQEAPGIAGAEAPVTATIVVAVIEVAVQTRLEAEIDTTKPLSLMY